MFRNWTIFKTINHQVSLPYFESGSIQYQMQGKYVMSDLCTKYITIPVPKEVKADYVIKATNYNAKGMKEIEKNSMVICESLNGFPEQGKILVVNNKQYGTLIRRVHKNADGKKYVLSTTNQESNELEINVK